MTRQSWRFWTTAMTARSPQNFRTTLNGTIEHTSGRGWLTRQVLWDNYLEITLGRGVSKITRVTTKRIAAGAQENGKRRNRTGPKMIFAWRSTPWKTSHITIGWDRCTATISLSILHSARPARPPSGLESSLVGLWPLIESKIILQNSDFVYVLIYVFI